MKLPLLHRLARVAGLRAPRPAGAPAAAPRQRSRTWRFLQVESSMACNIACRMCPWLAVRQSAPNEGRMPAAVWEALAPHLPETDAVDLSGGGEPLLQPELAAWLRQARDAGCHTGLLTNATLLDAATARSLADAGLDWLGVSLDGASAASYEQIRRGARFAEVCHNVRRMAALGATAPRIIIQTVLMPANLHELEAMVELAADLGAAQLTFKNCDVSRGEHGRGHGVYHAAAPPAPRLARRLRKATKLARKRGLELRTFRLSPDEQPVCDHDPRSALFVAQDGRVAPCINLAYGGSSEFLGRQVQLPTITYGRLPEKDLQAIWRNNTQRQDIAHTFDSREARYSSELDALASREIDLVRLKQGLERARESMPPAPPGCRVCHYLYGI